MHSLQFISFVSFHFSSHPHIRLAPIFKIQIQFSPYKMPLQFPNNENGPNNFLTM